MSHKSIRHQFNVVNAQTFIDDLQYQRSRYFYYLGGVAPWGNPDNAPTGVEVSFTGGTGAIGHAVVEYGVITGVTIEEPGVNYVVGSAVTFTELNGGLGATGTVATINACGGVLSVTITSGGFGYTPDYIPETEEENRKYRSEIVYLKQVSPNDVSLVIKRYDWTSGTIYECWDHTKDMRDKAFYVITDDNQVYKCLSNGGGYASIVKPTSRTTEPIVIDQGAGNGIYVWKYMYSISSFKNDRFSSPEYIPVQKALTDSFYNNGTIDDAIVIAGGTGYQDIPQTTITISGTTTGAGATAEIDSVGTDGSILGVNVLTPGSGYTKGATVVFSGGGFGAVGHVEITAGQITNIVIDEGGIGYTTSDAVNVDVGGANLIAVVSDTTGAILDVVIEDAGAGYTTAPTLAVVGTGTGIYGNASALLSCVEYEGSIVQVNILDPGQDYEFYGDTTIVAQGDGIGASFVPVVQNGEIVDVIVENKGEGYTDIFLTVLSDSMSGSGAEVKGIIAQSDYTSDQSVIEQVPSTGSIFCIKVTHPGSGYLSPANVSVVITGNGTGAAATPVISSTGELENIIMTSYGSGYTYADVTIVDTTENHTNILLTGPRASELALAYAILPPLSGHGADAPSELFADTVVINTPLRNELAGDEIIQDFRHFGIIKDPRSLLTGKSFANQSAFALYKVMFDASTQTTSLNKDELLITTGDGGAVNRYRVVEKNGQEVHLMPLDNDIILPIGNMSTVEEPIRNYISSYVVTPIEIDKYSGSLLYVSTENPFTFSETQSITIKTYIKF
jgi:hypothetical protein